MTIFSECLKNIRDSHGISTSDLAGMIGHDITTVHRWCNGSRTPFSFEPVLKIGDHMMLSARKEIV